MQEGKPRLGVGVYKGYADDDPPRSSTAKDNGSGTAFIARLQIIEKLNFNLHQPGFTPT
jgi:hypothetical protein